MQVKFLGFSLNITSNTLALSDYISHLQNKKDEPFVLNEHLRHVFVNEAYSQNYYIGLLITVKDQKRFCELFDANGKLTVRVNELGKDSKLMDFNFFAINKKSGFGMYQYYHQSCSIGSFGYLSKSRFNELKDLAIKKELDEFGKESISNKQEKAVKRKHKGTLDIELLVRKEKLGELIAELDAVKSFEYSVLSLDIQEPEFGPIIN